MTHDRHPQALPTLRAVLPDDDQRRTFWWNILSVLLVWAVGCWTWAMGVVPARTAAALTGALVVFAALTLNALWLTSRPVVVGAVVVTGLVKLLAIVGATTASGLLMALGAGMAALLIGSARLLALAQDDGLGPDPIHPIDRRRS